MKTLNSPIFKTDGPSTHLFHSLGLGSGADTAHRQTDVDGRADTLVEQLSLQEDLAVSDGDDVSRDVSRHISCLGLDDGESGERATTEVVVHLSGTFQQTGVEVEHITGVGLTTGGTTQQQRHLTVGHSLQTERHTCI